jgi:hypothetical protein
LGDPETYARRKAKLHQRLDALIDSPFDDADAKRLLKHMRPHRQEMLTFLEYDQVSSYNNHAEQQMRPAVLTRKISQQNRSADGAKAHAILMTQPRRACAAAGEFHSRSQTHPRKRLRRFQKGCLIVSITKVILAISCPFCS